MSVQMNNEQVDENLQTLSSTLQDSVRSIIKKAKYTKCDITIKRFDSLGNNFLGQLYEIDIIGETVDGKKDVNIFVKEIVEMENFNLLPVAPAYMKEVFMYTELSKIFTSLQDQANVPKEDRYTIAKAYDETNPRAIILENLCKRGFRVFGKLEPLPIECVESVIKELAKLHGLSFVIENKMPEYFNDKIKIKKNEFNFDEDWAGLMRKVCAHFGKLCDGDLKQKMEKFEPIFLDKFPKYNYDQTSVKCTLIHGDYKKNNLMIRVKDGEPIEVCPVDYQFICYGCPLIDLMGFIFTSTDRQLRKKHLNYLKDLYFGTLTRFLKYFDMDVEAVYPRREFEEVCTEWLDYGLMVGLFVSVFAFAPDDGLDLANKPLSEIPFNPGEEYDHIFRGLIDDFVEMGCL